MDHLDGPKAPWWESAPVAGETDEASGAQDTPAGRAYGQRGTPVVPSPPDALVAGPGVAAFDTRGALPAEQTVHRPGTGSPDFSDTEPDGIPIMGQAESAAVPGQASGGPPSNVATSADMAPPPEAAPVFDRTEDRTGSAAGSRADFADRLRAAGARAVGSGDTTATMPTMTPQNAPSRPPGVVSASAYHPAGGGPVPASAPPAPPAPASPGRDGRGMMLIIGGGIAAVLLAFLVVGIRAMTGPGEPTAASSTPLARATPQPSQATPRPGGTALAPSIDSERTDRRPLSLTEVFPTSTIMLGGRAYKQDKTSVNHQCGLAARGQMVTALQRGRCRSVVRATYVNGKKYAVTTGVAVMPTRAAALTASRAGEPSRYEWFRGMRGKVATKIDQAGGYASSTVRGRYLIYSYAQYVDGTRPQAADQALKTLTRQFIAYAVRPIDRRAQ